ncbi:hypothetical protein F4776DRAFT_45605 [Hypoxylon sp. NC0597]|nr:hypothetical protein F4776DRAFT_45605 [Hypoxylon sp. NC0597]
MTKKSSGEWHEKQVKCADLFPGTQWPFHPEDEVVLVVAQANEIRNCAVCCESFINGFHMPRFWWTDTYKRMNGYFGSESSRNTEGVVESCSTWSRALVKQFTASSKPEGDSEIKYQWLKYNLFTRWAFPGRIMILVFDPVESIQKRLCTILMQNLEEKELRDPYWPYAHILEEIVSLQDTSVWSLRNLVRTTELSPTRDHRYLREKPKHNYSRLHDIARHAIHVSETLDLSLKLSESLLQGHEQLVAGLQRGLTIENPQEFQRAYQNTHSRLAFFNNALSSLRCRSTSNHQRLNNEIQLRFHTDSQYDSQVSVEISHSAKSDSASMRWIAVVSLVFLPANLVSAFFSTIFFDVSNGAISVSKDLWIFWVVLIIVIVVTMVFWFYLPRAFPEDRTQLRKSTAPKEKERLLGSLARLFKREDNPQALATYP